MTLVDHRTGEVIEFDRAAAERRAERITMRLDAIAENYARVLPMIREAIEKRDDIALGYRSPGDYVSDRFGNALSNLGMDVRRAVVKELTDAGLSTRAIAPVVGVSNFTVHADQTAVRDLTPDEPFAEDQPEASAHLGLNPQTPRGEVTDRSNSTGDLDAARVDTPRPADHTPRPVTGIDGKTYTRGTQQPGKDRRKPLTDSFWTAVYDLGVKAESLHRLISDDRFPQNAKQVAAKNRVHLLRARDLLEQVINSLPENEVTP